MSVDKEAACASTESIGPMSESAIQEYPAAVQTRSEHAHRDRGLLLIGVFKLCKSIFFFLVGIGAIHLLHKDLGDVAMRLAQALHFDPEGKVVSFLIVKADLVNPLRLREAGFGAFAYSALSLTEGIGLMLEKVWAEYLTLCLTISFLPWELYELAREPDLMRLSLLLANLAVLAYIVWFLRRKKQLKNLRHD
jgi:uncharacterized membrane protein (DUF2068 family)